MAAACLYLGHTLGVSAWLVLGASCALHIRRGREEERMRSITRQMLEQWDAQMQADVARHKREMEAAYRDALERHEREAGRAFQ